VYTHCEIGSLCDVLLADATTSGFCFLVIHFVLNQSSSYVSTIEMVVSKFDDATKSNGCASIKPMVDQVCHNPFLLSKDFDCGFNFASRF
jgi:hypothetical protein